MKQQKNHILQRFLLIIIGGAGLFLVYLFQDHLDFYTVIVKGEAPELLYYGSEYLEVNPWRFGMNKVFRYLLNDLFAIALIYGLFHERKYLRFSFFVMLFGLLVLVPIYIGLYLAQPAGFSSMLTHLHRLVMNPVLMMLLIPAFFYQKRIAEGGM